MTVERMIAGHRVLRLLGRGARSRVWLAPGDLVLKVLSAPVAPDQPGREAQALHRARDEHVVELVDVSVHPDEVVLVHPRLPRGSLAEILAARRGLDAGEAVTILAPIAGALDRMHQAGVAHGAVSADHVLFRADGAPVLIGFGQATLFDADLPEVSRERLPGVLADRQALAALSDAVLGRVVGPRAAAAASFAETLRSAGLVDLEARLARGLFELAAARPVIFEIEDSDAGDGRVVGVQPVPHPHPVAPTGAVARLLQSGPVAVARDAARATWTAWSPRRRRVAIGVTAGVAAVMLAVAILPGPAAPAVPAEGPEIRPSPAASVPVAITADEPLEALAQLLRRRDDCVRDLSVLCLDDVDERDSAAYEDDRRAIQGVIDAGETPPRVSSDSATVLERLGDSVLIALGPDSDPASVLLMKGEAGWRVRSYLPD